MSLHTVGTAEATAVVNEIYVTISLYKVEGSQSVMLGLDLD